MRILPPLLWVFMVILIAVTHWVGWGPRIMPVPWQWAGAPVFLLGFAITIVANRHFRRVQTNVHTFRDPEKLVTSGLFARSRNPMYLGFSLSLLGAAVLANGWLALAPAALFWLISQVQYIPFEERAAERVFGDDWRTYTARVRRWI
jgi:protein-S-isoprenylcysteine O-methyltransferase Ste14